jgi:nucleoid-associated protein YgaU
MHIMGRVAAWGAVLGMPLVAWALARTAMTLWAGRGAVIQVEDLVAMGAAGLGTAVAGYLAVTGWAMLLGALARGGRSLPRSVAALAPVSWQRVTATALGVTMSAGLAAPALASQPSAPHVGWGEPVAAQVASPAHGTTATATATATSPVSWASPVALHAPASAGSALTVGFAPAPPAQVFSPQAPTPPASTPEPSRPAADQVSQSGVTALASAAAATDAGAAPASTYAVQRGDSLWHITATLLGPGASDISINQGWPELYAANLGAVGSDPALIQPGLVLTVPKGFQS